MINYCQVCHQRVEIITQTTKFHTEEIELKQQYLWISLQDKQNLKYSTSPFSTFRTITWEQTVQIIGFYSVRLDSKVQLHPASSNWLLHHIIFTGIG